MFLFILQIAQINLQLVFVASKDQSIQPLRMLGAFNYKRCMNWRNILRDSKNPEFRFSHEAPTLAFLRQPNVQGTNHHIWSLIVNLCTCLRGVYPAAAENIEDRALLEKIHFKTISKNRDEPIWNVLEVLCRTYRGSTRTMPRRFK